MRFKNETGNQYGHLTVLEYAGRYGDKSRCALWLCRCDCGNARTVIGKKLRNGRISSCTDCAEVRRRQKITTHGQTNHPLYATWSNMRDRCLNPNNIDAKHYGARGIDLYAPWQDDPRPFIEWIDENLGSRPKGHTLDRIDNDGNYEPGNLRWSTQSEQCQNSHSYHIEPALYRLLTEPIVFKYHGGTTFDG